jgi:hypothetical protein
MPINPQDNDNAKSSEGDNLFYLLKTKDSIGAGNRDENGLADKFFGTEDLAILQNSVLSQQLKPLEFKPGQPGQIKQAWAQYLAVGSDSFVDTSKVFVKSEHTLSWDTNFDGTEDQIVRARERAWANAVNSAWLGFVQKWYIANDFRNVEGGSFLFAEDGIVVSPALDPPPETGPTLVGGPIPDNFLSFNTKFLDAFWADISNVLSGPAGGPTLTKDDILSYIQELSTTRSLAFGVGSESYTLFKSYYRYYDSETGELKPDVSFPGSILDAINELYAPTQDTALEMMSDDVTSLYSIYNSVKGDLNNLQTNLGQIVKGETIVTGYENVNTQAQVPSIPPGDDPADYKELTTVFDVFGDFRQAIKTEEYGIPTTILSGVRVNFELIKNKTLSGLMDTPSGNISGQILIANGSGFDYTPYKFSGLLDTPTGYELGSYLKSTEGGIEYIQPTGIIEDLLKGGIEGKINLTGLKDIIDPSLESEEGDQKYLKYTKLNGDEYKFTWATIGENEDPSVQVAFTGLQDTPDSYLNESGKYLRVNDDEDGVSFVNGSQIIKDLPPTVNTPSCIQNLNEYNEYQEYQHKFFGNNMGLAFDTMLNNEIRMSENIKNICMHVQSNLRNETNLVLVDATNYKWGSFIDSSSAAISAIPDIGRGCAFSFWESNASIGNPNQAKTLVTFLQEDTVITGHFVCQ